MCCSRFAGAASSACNKYKLPTKSLGYIIGHVAVHVIYVLCVYRARTVASLYNTYMPMECDTFASLTGRESKQYTAMETAIVSYVSKQPHTHTHSTDGMVIFISRSRLVLMTRMP